MTLRTTRLLVALACWAAFAPCAGAQRFRERPVPLADALAADAALHDLAMVDAQHGWAVGDRGVIWFTEDGGRRWLRQESPVTTSLVGVSFVDAQHGWAVGGVTTPYTHSSHGVVLRTTNGGYSWQSLPAPLLPRLREVKFFDQQRGVAWGDGSAIAPSGVFHTRDAGLHWEPVHSEQPGTWLAAALADERSGVALGADGLIAHYDGGAVTPLLSTTTQALRAASLARDGRGWLVGHGAALATTDGGRRWAPVNFPSEFEARGVAQNAAGAWVVGVPGTVVLHSPTTQTPAGWHSRATGVPSALNAIQFASETHGWAVGELGTILATTDGGQTWQLQQQGGARCAALVVAPTAADLPLELIAKLGAGEGYLTAAVAVLGNPADSLPELERFRDAAIGAGATIAEMPADIGLLPSELDASTHSVLKQLDQRTGGDGRAAVNAYLAGLLDRLRPEAVFIVATPHRSVGQVVESAVLQAAQRDSASSAWRPTRVLRVQQGLSSQMTGVSLTDFDPRLNTSLRNWAAPHRGLLTKSVAAPTEHLTWNALIGSAPAGQQADPLAGLVIEHGGPARRAQTLPPDSGLAALKSLALKQEQRDALLQNPTTGEDWAGRVLGLTGGLDDDAGATQLTELAAAYRQRGDAQRAIDAEYLLARRYPEHPLAEHAVVQLVRYYASAEAALVATSALSFANSATSLPAADQPSTTPSPPELAEHLGRAIKLGDYLRQAQPNLYASPSIAFPLAAALRATDQEDQAQAVLAPFSRNTSPDAWRSCLQLEEWLVAADSRGARPAPKPVLAASIVQDRPLLDGALDESFWQAAQAVELARADSAERATVRIAYDDEFLYLAVSADKLPGAAYPDDRSARPRDADLSGYDRVALRIDTNRDYTTSLQLAVDCRGWTQDRCDEQPAWNPRWYVAAAGDAKAWRVEAAIPLDELSHARPTASDAWAISLERHAPGRLVHTWTGAASEDGSPDAFGALLFE